ncbi:transcription factor atf21 [Trichoderma asperellum]|uniref:Transcription factor atf21 n=1 Tax=Trichoderma asperellum TaxID=101201 RepID=A0A6V8QVD8_TRIAP|nr:transcription factor atf21 [Trichoderma asperellum]
MSDSPVFAEYGGLGIHNLPGPLFPFDFYKEDPIAVDPGLTLSPYATSPDSPFTSPEPMPLPSPPSCNEYFADHRDSIGSLDTTTIAPHETVTNTVAVKNSSHGSHSNNAKSNNNRPSKATPISASASVSASVSTSTSTPTAAPQPPTSTSPMLTRTRKASSQNVDASGSAAQPRAKKQKTAASAQSITVKQEPQEPQQQRQQQQRQRQSPPPPKRKPSRRGSTAKKEDVAQRTKNLERNRIAASKCRQKKKEWVVELEETKTSMELRHNTLRMEYFQLLDEVTSIKNQLMAHATCNDPNINFWIEKEALKYVERCMDPAQERRPSIVANAASGSCTLPSPAESNRSQQESPLPKPESASINLDYMPDELLTGDFV